MKNYWLFALLVLALGATGCKDDHNNDPQAPAFNLNFHATYNGAAIEKYKAYPYGAMQVRWTRFNLFVSDVTFLKGTEEVAHTEIAFLDFTPDNAAGNETKTVTLGAPVPAGDYTGIRIGFGVKPTLNAKKPADYAPSHPLYNESEYWPGWSSYIFSKLEGGADTDGNNSFDLDLVFHCGGNQTYKVFEFNHPFTVGENGGSMDIDLDVLNLLTFNGQLFDIVTTPTTSHGQSGVDLMEDLQDNFDNATVLH